MAYRLRDGEAVPDALRRCAREQLDTAITELTEAIDEDPVDAVHSARKALKQDRSLLRLGRGALDARQRCSENDAVRGIARSLGGVRDQDVLVQTFDELAGRFVGQVPQADFAGIRKAIAGSRTPEPPRSRSDAMGVAVNELRSARRRIDQWQLDGGGWSIVRPGLIRGYRRGRSAFAAACSEPSAENMHEWRKRAKDLWYHLRLLRPIAPGTLRGQADEAHRLSDLLGDHHDLSVLDEALLAASSEVSADVDAVRGLIEYRRGELEVEAFFLGRRVYAESPKVFERRMRRYWKAWRAETRAAHSRPPAELAQATRVPLAT
jgi:CHAD domain-containing protein